MHLPDGCVAPSFMRFEERHDVRVEANREFALRVGTIVNSYAPTDSQSLTHSIWEYDVECLVTDDMGQPTLLVYPHAIMSTMFGSISDYLQWAPRISAKRQRSSTEPPDLDALLQGSMVALLAPNGNHAVPALIIGAAPHPLAVTDSADFGLGPLLRFEYNGLFVEINKEGELVVRRKGPTADDGTPVNGNDTQSTDQGAAATGISPIGAQGSPFDSPTLPASLQPPKPAIPKPPIVARAEATARAVERAKERAEAFAAEVQATIAAAQAYVQAQVAHAAAVVAKQVAGTAQQAAKANPTPTTLAAASQAQDAATTAAAKASQAAQTLAAQPIAVIDPTAGAQVKFDKAGQVVLMTGDGKQAVTMSLSDGTVNIKADKGVVIEVGNGMLEVDTANGVRLGGNESLVLGDTYINAEGAFIQGMDTFLNQLAGVAGTLMGNPSEPSAVAAGTQLQTAVQVFSAQLQVFKNHLQLKDVLSQKNSTE